MSATEDPPDELLRANALLEHVDELVTVIDADARFAYVSPSFERFFGRDEDTLVGAVCFDGVHPDDIDSVTAAFTQVVETPGANLSVEYRHQDADGSWRWLQTTGTNHIGTPHIGGVLAVSRDITDRRERREQLEVYETIVDLLPSAVMIKDREGHYRLANEQASGALDVDEEDVIGATDEDLFGPEVGSEIWTRERAAIEEADGAVTYEDNVTIGDESRVYLSTRVPMRDEDGEVEQILGVSRDITDQQNRKEQLETYRVRLETAMENAHFAWWEMDLATGHVAFSEQKSDFLQIDPDDYSHYEDFTALVHPDDYESAMQAMRDHMEGEADRYDTKYRIRRSDGEYIWFHDVGQITRTDGDGPGSVVGITLEITTQRQYEQRLAALNVALAELLAAGSKADVTEKILDIVSETVPTIRATIALASEDGEHLDQLFTTDSQGSLRSESDALSAPLGSDHWLTQAYRGGEVVEQSDGSEVDSDGLDGTNPPSGRVRALPVGTHGVFMLASPSTDPFDRSVTDFIDVLVQVAEAVYDRVSYETNLRETKTSLEQRQRRLDVIIQNAPVILFSFDRSGIFTQSVGRGLELIGLEPGEVVGESVFEFSADESITAACHDALAGELVKLESSVGDQAFQNWFVPMTDESGAVTEVLGVAVDITSQVRQERRLAALSNATNELMYARSTSSVGTEMTAIFENHFPAYPAIVWVWSDETETLEPVAYSQAAANAVSEGQDVREIRPLDPGTWERTVFETGEEATTDDYLSLPNPSHPGVLVGSVVAFPLSEHAILAAAAPDGDFQETDIEFLRVLANTSEAALDRAAREEALEAYKDELERSNENLQEFAYIASHDLQEPLRMVSSYLSLLALEYEGELDEEADEYIDFAVDGAERMKSMIEALLQYSRVHTRAQPFDRVNLETVVVDVLQSLSLAITEADATVTHDSLPTVECDGDQLGQVFQNLIANAIGHTGDDSTRIHVGVTEFDDEYQFSVDDDGKGISTAEQRHVFDIFKRGARGDSDDGTGIGLAICERIVERHGGDIWVESEEGEGATFYFTIAKKHQPKSAFGMAERDPRETT